MPLAFSKDEGAVTAEFMLLTPTIVLALAGALGLFQLGLERLALSQSAFYEARSQAIGHGSIEQAGIDFQTRTQGQLLCVTASKSLLFKIEESGCYLIHGA